MRPSLVTVVTLVSSLATSGHTTFSATLECAGVAQALSIDVDDHPDHSLAAEMAQALLMNASDPNARRKDGRTALQLALARNYSDIVEMLVHRGADPAGTAVDAGKIEKVYFGRRYSFDAEGRPFTPENIDGLPQDFINQFVTFAHFDSERVKHLLKIAPGLLAARAT